MFHVGADEADVHAVDVVDDEHDHEQRQDVAFHFRDGGLQDRIGAIVHPGYGCIHFVFSHSLFLCGVWLDVAMLIDIIQLVFLIKQALHSNKMAIYLGVAMLFLV
jgi:hypothetical protein